MKVIANRPSDREVLAVVEEWVELLAQGQYAGALSLVEHDSVWTAADLQELIESYGPPPPPHDQIPSRVTSVEAAVVSDCQPARTVSWYPPHPNREASLEALVHFDLPVNGTWSDLTALFWVKRIGSGYVLMLEDVHVL